MKFSDKILSQTITQLCLAKGIDHIVISPGSRNAPLTIGFTENNLFKNFSVVDERCAAFFAMGLAQQIQKPVALVCTSGSALLNYYPAVAEAFYSDIPLVVISADRPEAFLEIGDGQTINQMDVFANHILYSASCKNKDEEQIFNETEINIALNTAIELNGPVHINVPFAEPLYNKVEELYVTPQNVPARIFNAEDEDFSKLFEAWQKCQKKMILVGVLKPNSVEATIVDYFTKDPSVIILTETTSNLHHKRSFESIDQLIAPFTETDYKELQPEILLTFGGMVVSKKIKAFLRNFPPKEHWHVDPKKAYDTYFSLTETIKCKPEYFLELLRKNTNTVESLYYRKFENIRKHRLVMHKKYLEEIPFSDFKVFELILKNLPKSIQLQLSNSATIRYSQLFDLDNSWEVFCNRGTSGIDGSTSTAIGAALHHKLPTVLITGDLSFLYDSNALWNNYIRNDFKIIIINNSGGGIFKILPGADDSENFSTFFETKHDLNAKHLAKMYGFGYTSADSEESLSKSLSSFFEENVQPQILEIFTPSEINGEILLDYFKYIK